MVPATWVPWPLSSWRPSVFSLSTKSAPPRRTRPSKKECLATPLSTTATVTEPPRVMEAASSSAPMALAPQDM